MVSLIKVLLGYQSQGLVLTTAMIVDIDMSISIKSELHLQSGHVHYNVQFKPFSIISHCNICEKFLTSASQWHAGMAHCSLPGVWHGCLGTAWVLAQY